MKWYTVYRNRYHRAPTYERGALFIFCSLSNLITLLQLVHCNRPMYIPRPLVFLFFCFLLKLWRVRKTSGVKPHICKSPPTESQSIFCFYYSITHTSDLK